MALTSSKEVKDVKDIRRKNVEQDKDQTKENKKDGIKRQDYDQEIKKDVGGVRHETPQVKDQRSKKKGKKIQKYKKKHHHKKKLRSQNKQKTQNTTPEIQRRGYVNTTRLLIVILDDADKEGDRNKYQEKSAEMYLIDV